MSEVTELLRQLFVIFLAAKIADELFERIHQPPVIGELLVGVLVGPFALGLVGRPDTSLIEAFHGDTAAAQEAVNLVFHLLAELSVVVLLFFVGLETRVADIARVGAQAGIVAVVGVVIPFALGYGFIGLILQHPRPEAIFVGAAMVATSVGITARVLRDLGTTTSTESRIILGAAVIDDILAMIVLAVAAGIATTGSVSVKEVVLIAVQALLFTAFVVLVGSGTVRQFGLHLEKLKMDGAPLSVSLLAMLGLATLAAEFGLAAIIGAFLAGMVFAEAREHFELEHQALPIYRFLVPFFFVITGSQVDWRLFMDLKLMGVALAITGLAVVGKLVGCGLPVLNRGVRSAATVGIGMVPRGEVGLIVASLGLSTGAIGAGVFSVVVIMSILTTLIAPPLLRILFSGQQEFVPADGGDEY